MKMRMWICCSTLILSGFGCDESSQPVEDSPSGDVKPKFQLEIDIEDRKLKVEARSNPDENATKKLEIKIHGTPER